MLLLAHSNAAITLIHWFCQIHSKHVHMYLERSKTLTPDRGAVALNLTPVLFNRKHLRLPGFKCLVHNYIDLHRLASISTINSIYLLATDSFFDGNRWKVTESCLIDCSSISSINQLIVIDWFWSIDKFIDCVTPGNMLPGGTFWAHFESPWIILHAALHWN